GLDPEGRARALGVAEPSNEARGAAALALENRRGPREQVELRAPGAALSPSAAERARQRPLHHLLDAARNEGIERRIGQSIEGAAPVRSRRAAGSAGAPGPRHAPVPRE